MHVHVYHMHTHTEDGRARLSHLGDKSLLPWPSVPQGLKVNESNKALVVVPMSNDMHSTGDNKHPGNGLVEGKILVQKTPDCSRGTLIWEREREREREREERG